MIEICIKVSCWGAEGLPLPGAGGGGGGLYLEIPNLQLLARQNSCYFVKLSEQIMEVWQKLLMQNRGCCCTMRALRQLTPVNHPKMYPPKQPIESQQSLLASTPPVFLPIILGGYWVLFVLFESMLMIVGITMTLFDDCQYFLVPSGWLLLFLGGALGLFF